MELLGVLPSRGEERGEGPRELPGRGEGPREETRGGRVGKGPPASPPAGVRAGLEARRGGKLPSSDARGEVYSRREPPRERRSVRGPPDPGAPACGGRGAPAGEAGHDARVEGSGREGSPGVGEGGRPPREDVTNCGAISEACCSDSGGASGTTRSSSWAASGSGASAGANGASTRELHALSATSAATTTSSSSSGAGLSYPPSHAGVGKGMSTFKGAAEGRGAAGTGLRTSGPAGRTLAA